jgi:hypothetical protein
MNYIRHLTAFLQKVKSDNRLNSSHVSLYLALFHYWNINMFENPLSVNRAQMLELSKIGSQHTYYKCLKELHLFGYIRYIPSHHPSKGCLVSLCTFDITSEDTCANMHKLNNKNDDSIAAKMHNHGCKNDITLAAKMQPSINNINNKTYCGESNMFAQTNLPIKTANMENHPTLNFKTLTDETTQAQNPDLMNLDPEKEPGDMKTKRKKVAPKKEKVGNEVRGHAASVIDKIPPSLDLVKTFFKIESFPELEAHKFFNHFQSNGWRVGGKSPMKDWHAAARNWMLNAQKFANPGQPKSTNLNTNKRYDIPL